MTAIDILPAPLPKGPETKWERERRAFCALLPGLLATHRGKYVAVHDGQVVAVGDDEIPVAMEAFAKVGYVPLHVGRVSTDPPRVARVGSPRVLRDVR